MPDTAVANAWKCETSPSLESESLFSTSSYFPLTTFIAVEKYLRLGKPKYTVKKAALPINRSITKG